MDEQTRFTNAGKIGSARGITMALLSDENYDHIDNYTRNRLLRIQELLDSIEL